jgi:hypothetical protein
LMMAIEAAWIEGYCWDSSSKKLRLYVSCADIGFSSTK